MGTFDGLASGLFGGPNVNQPAAQINQAGAQAWQGNPGDANANQGAEQAAQGLELAQANGTGPSQAVEMLKAQTAAAQNNANAIASSGSGSSGQGIQRRNAMMAGAGATQALGGQAAAARAGEQQAAIQGLGNMANQSRGLDLQASGINANQADTQAQLTEQQNINNQGVQSQQQGANAGTLGNLASAAASAASAASRASASSTRRASGAKARSRSAIDGAGEIRRGEPSTLPMRRAIAPLSRRASATISTSMAAPS